MLDLIKRVDCWRGDFLGGGQSDQKIVEAAPPQAKLPVEPCRPVST